MLVSIVVPVYKVEKYLRQCLDSVLAQTVSDWEAICVDDGSTDGTGEMLDGLVEGGERSWRYEWERDGGIKIFSAFV